MSTTRITDNDYADVALYDKVNAIANEIDNEVSKKANSSNTVTTNTAQTITSKKTFTDTIIHNAQRDSTVTPSTYIERIILQTNDSNGLLNTSLRTGYRADGTIDTLLYTGRDGTNKAFVIRITSDGRCTMLGQTPLDSAKGVEMTTAAWVNTKLGNYVPLSGANITGDLIRKIDIDPSQFPTSNTYLVPWVVENSDQSVRAYQQIAYFTGGIIQNTFGLRRKVNGANIFNGIDVQIDKDGNKAVNVMSPPTNSNSGNIATTSWVNTFCKSTNKIVESWSGSKSDSWYRKWSNGFIEQGGIVSSGTTNGVWLNFSKTFYQPFTQTPSIFVNYLATQGEGYNCMKSLSTTAFSFGSRSTANNYHQNSMGISFYACGF